jgi:hypothetical protein
MAEISCFNNDIKKNKRKYFMRGDIYAETKVYTENEKTFAHLLINKLGNIIIDIKRDNKRYIITINSEDKELGIWKISENLKEDITKHMLEEITE